MDFLKNGKNLEYISLEHHPNMDYTAITECSNLKTLDFWDCDVSELNMLSGLKELESLSLLETNVSEAGDIVELKTLKELVIRNTPLAGNGDALALILEKCPNIEKLYLKGKSGGLKDLSFLKNGKNLKEFVLESGLLDSEAVIDSSAIAECTKLACK